MSNAYSHAQTIFPHGEGKNSLMESRFHFRSMQFKNRWCNILLCDVTQSLKLQQSCRETACCKDHLFRIPRNEDSVNLKPQKALWQFYQQHLKLRNSIRLLHENDFKYYSKSQPFKARQLKCYAGARWSQRTDQRKNGSTTLNHWHVFLSLSTGHVKRHIGGA